MSTSPPSRDLRSGVALIPCRCGVLLMYASLPVISGALHLNVFEQPAKNDFFNTLVVIFERSLKYRISNGGQ